MRACFCNVHVLENAFYANHFWAQTGNLIMYNLIQAVIIYLSVMKKKYDDFFWVEKLLSVTICKCSRCKISFTLIIDLWNSSIERK